MIECIRFQTHKKNYLQGFADIFVPKWGIEIKGCSLHMKNGRRWIGFPSREYITEEGEKAYAPIIKFRDRSHMDAFSTEAKAAIDKWCENNGGHNGG